MATPDVDFKKISDAESVELFAAIIAHFQRANWSFWLTSGVAHYHSLYPTPLNLSLSANRTKTEDYGIVAVFTDLCGNH